MYYPDYPYYQNYYQFYSYLPKYGYNTAFSHQAASSPQCQVGLGKQPQRKQKETAALQGSSSSQGQLLSSSASSGVYSQNQLVLDRQENKESDMYKQQIVQWLKSMDIDQRFEVFMIKDKWFAQTITKMYWKQKTGEFSAFALYSEEEKKDSRNTNKIVELDSQFYCRKCIDHDSVSNAPRREAEQEIVKVLRVIDDKEIYDSLVFDKGFLDNIDHLIDVFDIVSDNNIFQTSHFSQYSWFHQNTFQTIACWIVSQFERMVQYKFIEDRQRYHQKLGRQPQGLISSPYSNNASNQSKESNKSDEKFNDINGNKLNGNNYSTAESSGSDVATNGNCPQSKHDSYSYSQNSNSNSNMNNSSNNTNMTNQGYNSFNIDSHSSQENLSHYLSLLQYWRSMNSSKKRKILNKGSEMHKTLVSQSQIEGLDKNDKQLEWYKKIKDQFYQKQKLPNDEEIQQNLLQFLDDQKAEKFIDQLCFTSLDDTTNVITIILKKLHERLNEMYSDQITQYLIHNDELEKSVKKKKNNTQNQGSQNGAKKKKKSVKAKSKGNSGANNETNPISQPPIKETTFAEEVSLMHQQEILQDQQEKIIQQQQQQQLQQIQNEQQKQVKSAEKADSKSQSESQKQENLNENEEKSSSLENSKKCDNLQGIAKQGQSQINKKKAAVSSMPLVLKMQQQQKKNEYLEVCCQQNKCEMIDMTKQIAQRLISSCIQVVDTFSQKNEKIDSNEELLVLKKIYQTDNYLQGNTNNTNQTVNSSVNGTVSSTVGSKKKKKSKNQNISQQNNNASSINSRQNLKQKQSKSKQETLTDRDEGKICQENEDKQLKNNANGEDTEELPHQNYSDSDQDGAKKGSEIHSDNTTIDCQYRMCSAITISSSSKRKQSDYHQSNSSSRHTTKNINPFSDEDDFKHFNDQINQVNNKKSNLQKNSQYISSNNNNTRQQNKPSQNEKNNQNIEQSNQQNKNLRQGNHKLQDRKQQQNEQDDVVLEKEIYSLTISQNNDVICNSSMERESLVSSRSSSQIQISSQISLNHQNSMNNNNNQYTATVQDDSDFIQVSGRKKNNKNQQQVSNNNNRKNQNSSNMSNSNNSNSNSNRQNGRKNNNNSSNNTNNNNNNNNNSNNTNSKNQNRRNNRNEKQIQGDGRQNNHQLRNNRSQDDQQFQLTKENSIVSEQSQQQINEEELSNSNSTLSRFTQKSNNQQKDEAIVTPDLTTNNSNKQTNQHSKHKQQHKKPLKIVQKQVVINTIDILTSKEEESPELKQIQLQQQQQSSQISSSLNLQSQISQDTTQTFKQTELDSQKQENQQSIQQSNINTKITSTIISNSTINNSNNSFSNLNSQENSIQSSNFCQQQSNKHSKQTPVKKQKLQQKSPLTVNSDKFQVREEYIQKSQLIQQQQQQQQQNSQTQSQPKENSQPDAANQMSPIQAQNSPTITANQASQAQGQNGTKVLNQASQPILKKKQVSNRKKSSQANNGQGNVQESYVVANPQQRKNKNGAFQNQWKDSNDPNNPPVVHQTHNNKAKAKIAKRLFKRKINNDILSFTEMINLESYRHQPSRFLIFYRIQHLLKKQFEKVESQVDLRIFGSCATGLSLPTSDIDLGITGFECHPRSDLIYILNQLANILEQFKWVKSIERIFTASIPIIKMEVDPFIDFKECINQDELLLFFDPIETQNLNLLITEENQSLKGIQLKVDITVECQMQSPNSEILNHMGFLSTDFVVRWMGYYVRLQPMTIVMKCFLHARNLNTNFKGGISSYCLLIMIIAFFRDNQNISQSDDYSKILTNFLKYYGTTFNPETIGISLVNANPFFPCVRNPSQSKLQVVDPLTSKIMTQNTYLIDEIFKEFQIFFNKLNDFSKKVEKQLDKMTYEQIERLDHMDFDQQKEELNKIFEKNIIQSIIYEIDNNKTELYEKIFKQEQQSIIKIFNA
ncbi:hypothetical protein ABPG72_009132 [Tetrahymena utriculariae]